jgi:hypothetical protein
MWRVLGDVEGVGGCGGCWGMYPHQAIAQFAYRQQVQPERLTVMLLLVTGSAQSQARAQRC